MHWLRRVRFHSVCWLWQSRFHSVHWLRQAHWPELMLVHWLQQVRFHSAHWLRRERFRSVHWLRQERWPELMLVHWLQQGRWPELMLVHFLPMSHPQRSCLKTHSAGQRMKLHPLPRNKQKHFQAEVSATASTQRHALWHACSSASPSDWIYSYYSLSS